MILVTQLAVLFIGSFIRSDNHSSIMSSVNLISFVLEYHIIYK